MKFLMENFPTLEQHLSMGIEDPARMRHYTFEEAKAAALDLIERSFLNCMDETAIDPKWGCDSAESHPVNNEGKS